MISKSEDNLSISAQLNLLSIARSSYYYKAKEESKENIRLMGEMDKLYTDMPYLGSRKLAAMLKGDDGFPVNRKRIRRLMALMGLRAIYPKKYTSIADVNHKKYPYLLRNLPIIRMNQVWATDITFIKLARGFLYLVAIMDLYSRRVLSWEISNTLDTAFCTKALRQAIEDNGWPEIFNSDQGCQFTSSEFTGVLEANPEVKISMDGVGRCYDNIFVERLWRSVKYEEVYLHSYEDADECRKGLAKYFEIYNAVRPHEALKYKTPNEIYNPKHNSKEAA